MPLKVKKVTGPTIAASVLFNGSNQYLSLPNTSTMQMGTSDYTVEAWIYPTANGQANTSQIFAQSAAGVSSQFIVGLTSANKIVNYIEYAAGGGSAGPVITSATSITLNKWTHIATARVSGVTRIFINGVLDASASDAGGYRVVSHNFSIGSQNGAGSTFFTGYISNLRVIKGTGLYASNFTPPTATLTAVTNTSLLTCHDTTIRDASTNNFTITNNNTATVSTVSPFPVLRSVSFNGSDQYLSIANNSGVQLNTGNFTIEGWIYVTAFPSSVPGNDLTNLVDKDGIQGSTYSSYSIRCTNSGGVIKLKVDCNTSPGGGTTGAVTSTTTINAGTWYHFAYVRNGANVYLYINGNQESSAGISDFYTSTGPLYIGYTNNGSSRTYWPGYISNFRIVKGAAVYTSSFTTSAVPLTAITSCSLLTCNDQTIRDASVNNFTITNNNTATVSTVTPFTAVLPSSMKFKRTANVGVAGRSVSFNGTSQYLTLPGNAVFAFGTGDFTVEGWVYLSAAQGNQYIVDARSPAYTNNWCFGWGLGSAGLFQWYYNGVIATNSSTTDFNTNTWYHVAYVRSGGTGTLYKNGVSVGTGADTNNYNVTSETVTIARRYSTVSSAEYFGGNISNFRIVKGTAVYTTAFTPPTSPLTAIANTSLLTCNAQTIVDSSTNNFTITNNGTATVSSAVTPFLSTPGTFKVKKSAGVYMVATGGDLVTTSGSYKVHTFRTVGTSSFVVSSLGSTPIIECLIVGGGGGGGGRAMGGGGGGGGVVYTSSALLATGSFSAIVGAGGIAATGMATSTGKSGGNTLFTYNGITTTALGGGGGGTEGYAALSGANGGGGHDASGVPGSGSAGGFPGGSGSVANYLSNGCGGGGGGAGGAGVAGVAGTGGNGGIGAIYNITGSAYYGGGGGGGGNAFRAATAGAGGLGGGGLGGRTSPGTAGTANTGGGGGGGGYNGTTGASETNGGDGGSGIILIKYRYTD